MIWQRHVWSQWRNGVQRSRSSGVSLLLTAVPMVVSGYLIQTATAEGWRTAWVVVHLAASGLWLLGYACHHLAALRSRLRQGQEDEARVNAG
jgi:hypothetical protein